MRRFRWIVQTNCRAGAEDGFDRWYDEVHIPDLLRIPGIVAARRGRLADVQLSFLEGSLAPPDEGSAYRFLAIYEFETDDPADVLREIVRRANTPDLMVSKDLTDARTILYEDLPVADA